jgi:hypothetical protein
MKNPLTPPKFDTSYKIVTVILCTTALLLLMTLFASCTATKSPRIYGNQNSHCESYQCIDIEK